VTDKRESSVPGARGDATTSRLSLAGQIQKAIFLYVSTLWVPHGLKDKQTLPPGTCPGVPHPTATCVLFFLVGVFDFRVDDAERCGGHDVRCADDDEDEATTEDGDG